MSMISSIRHLNTWAATRYFNQFPSYCQMVAEAKQLARRSLLIDHCGYENIDLSSGLRNVERVYSIEKEGKRGPSKFSLVELKSEDDAKAAAEKAGHNTNLMPITLKFLQYDGSDAPINKAQQNLPFPIHKIRLPLANELSTKFDNYTALMANNAMSLIELKLRFITLVNIESILCSGIFDAYELIPFGSSVIDIGTNSGDLDIVLARRYDHHEAILSAFSNTLPRRTETRGVNDIKLKHIDKSPYDEYRDRNGFRNIMRWFDFVLRDYMPLIEGTSVQSIYNAKVPIIKFHTRISSIDCDLSFDLGLDYREDGAMSPARTSIPMTEALYCLARGSNIFTALVIYMRIFAKATTITSKEPNVGMTNFQLLTLVIFYLQQISITSTTKSDNLQADGAGGDRTKKVFTIGPIEGRSDRNEEAVLPSFRRLISSNFTAPYAMLNLTDDELNQVLPHVIVDFFRFYSAFDFENTTLNIYESRKERKLDNSVVYVVNPIDKSKNVCHNVNRAGHENFVLQMRLALARIERSNEECPLSVLKSLVERRRRQIKKAELLRPDTYTRLKKHFTSFEIAEDVCK